MLSLARWLILLASILFAAGLMHVIGYSFLLSALVKSGVESPIIGAVKAVLFVLTVELVVLGPAFVWISLCSGARPLLLYLALIPVIDDVLMYHFVKLFIGNYLVAGGALLLLAGAWILPHADLQ